MVTPYEEQEDATIALEQKLFSYCPYCGRRDNIIEDYHIRTPPLHDSIVITWTCQCCVRNFITSYELDEEGLLKEGT